MVGIFMVGAVGRGAYRFGVDGVREVLTVWATSMHKRTFYYKTVN